LSEQWPDGRLDDLASMVRTFAPVATQVARIEATLDAQTRTLDGIEGRVEKFDEECTTRDRRVHERIDQLARDLADRDREYRRNIVLAIGPIVVVALLIGAKVLFGLDLPHP
jgi:hypothetical protein